MMAAAMIAASFAESDPFRLIQIGLSEIPSKSRLALWVRTCLEWIEDVGDATPLYERIWTEVKSSE